MLDKDTKDILDENDFLNNRKDNVKISKFTKSKHRLFFVSIFIGLAIVIGLYFLSSYSNVYHVVVNGNIYYSDEEIRQISGIDETSKFLLINNKDVKTILEEDVLIKEASVEKLDGNVINITVEEHKIIGYISEEGTTYLLLTSDGRIEVNKDNMHLISQVPLIVDFDADGLLAIEKGFSKIDASLISEISEIHHYPFSYDQNMMELIMSDGNYCFISASGLEMLSQYYNVISNLNSDEGKRCFIVDEVSNTYQDRACPWEKKDEVIVENEEGETDVVEEN